MDTTKATRTPPAVGRTTGARILDDDMRDDLAILMTAHGDQAAAIRTALRHLADTYRLAWDHGDVPRGTAPRVLAARYRCADGRPSPVVPAPNAVERPLTR